MQRYRIKMFTGIVYILELEGVAAGAPIGSLRLAWDKGRSWSAREDLGTHWPLGEPAPTYINPEGVASVVAIEGERR